VLERLGHWLAGLGVQVVTWFNRRPGGVQFLIVVVLVLLVVGVAHFDELKREREWRLFRLWLEERRRAMQLRLPRGMR